jgi:hypothetical protein
MNAMDSIDITDVNFSLEGLPKSNIDTIFDKVIIDGNMLNSNILDGGANGVSEMSETSLYIYIGIAVIALIVFVFTYSYYSTRRTPVEKQVRFEEDEICDEEFCTRKKDF